MKRVAAVACVAAAMFVGAGTASAENRQPSPTLMLNPSQVAPGGAFTATLRIPCVDGATIEFSIEPAGDFTPAICANNTFTARLTGPSRPTTYDVEAVGEVLLAEAKLTVTAALGGVEQPLPSTGPDQALSIAMIAGALFVGGVALLGLARRTTPTAAR